MILEIILVNILITNYYIVLTNKKEVRYYIINFRVNRDNINPNKDIFLEEVENINIFYWVNKTVNINSHFVEIEELKNISLLVNNYIIN